MSDSIKSPRKLIEVALPLDAINAAAKEEKSVPRRGHPQTLHVWWARRPLAVARAVIFAQLVNDPGYQQGSGFKYGKNKKDAAIERKRLFKILEDLVPWKNSANEEVLERAKTEIRRSWQEVCELNKNHPRAAELFNPERLPAVHDPFAGGGTIPLEAQRLGIEAYASDLNPVAVLLSKAMIEIPSKFVGITPVGPLSSAQRTRPLDLNAWPGATGMSEDVRRYGAWILTEARKRIGAAYPEVEITPEMLSGRPDLKPLLGQKLSVIASLWTRTVKSPNPAFSEIDVPLASTFMLSIKPGKEVYVEPVIESPPPGIKPPSHSGYNFTVRVGKPPDARAAMRGTKSGSSRTSFLCLMSGAPISFDYVRLEAKAGRLGARLMAIVAESAKGRVYLSPTIEMESVAASAEPQNVPETDLPDKALGFRIQEYGMKRWRDLFTPRQLLASTTFSELVQETRERIKSDAIGAGLHDDGIPLAVGGVGAAAYADAISVYLGCALSRLASYNNTICHWNMRGGSVGGIFSRHAIPMSWDYIEINPLEKMSGNWSGGIEWVCDVLSEIVLGTTFGVAQQANASNQTLSIGKIVSTDPPYYDNIGYADLSDFFYVWLRQALRPVFPDLFATVTVPKAEELVATPFRHGNKKKAEMFFLDGMTQALNRVAEQAHPAFPVTIYYAFKQSQSDEVAGTTSTGWDTFLAAVIRSGFVITGTWPMRTERTGRPIEIETNALASSIVLVCRKRADDAPTISRREFIRELNIALPDALDVMTRGGGGERSPVAPVDLSQAIIGPGMAVFTRYAAVLEADGSPMSVRTALQLINRFLAEDDFDADTQFCLHWFEQFGWLEGPFGTADTLSRGKGTSVDGMRTAGVLRSGGGTVRLLRWAEYPIDWDPRTDARTPVWEALHQLIRALKSSNGEAGAGALLAALGGKAEAIRQLAYRLYTLCERLGQAEDARVYNELITSWTGIEVVAATAPGPSDGLLPGFED
jgi:putative DNA methylase